jgi:hypothetical protein
VSNFELKVEFYPHLEDFTFFREVTQLRELFGETYPEQLIRKVELDDAVCLKQANRPSSLDGRLNLTQCYAGKYVSCTFRATGRLPSQELTPYRETEYRIRESKYNPDPPKEPENKEVDENPVGNPNDAGQQEVHLNSMQSLCDVLYRRIFPESVDVHGLIVIAGATASGKSQVARGLIYMYLQSVLERIGTGRRPHLVTFEDPIDKYWASDPKKARSTGIDYTPREYSKDVASLEEAVTAALRQTPRVFFVGETRRPEDWKELSRFASTGHLCVTTSHAGSLTEAMGQIFQATEASTPARRSEVANRILALVHLRTHKVSNTKDGAPDIKITVPAIWVRSAVSTKAMMADGLTSLLPYRDPVVWDNNPGCAGAFGCLGRSWFATQLLTRPVPEIQNELVKDIERLVLGWDLEGL